MFRVFTFKFCVLCSGVVFCRVSVCGFMYIFLVYGGHLARRFLFTFEFCVLCCVLLRFCVRLYVYFLVHDGNVV